MKLDDLQQEHISYCLEMWHKWSKASDRVGVGYPRVSAGFGNYRTSRQYDMENGALDDKAEMDVARSVEMCVALIPDPWRTALHIEAKNLAGEARVWATARIDLDELKRVTQEARGKLWDELGKAGLL